MAGTILFFLDGLRYFTVKLFRNRLDGGGDLVSLVAYDDHKVLRVHPGCSMECMAEQ